MNAAACLVAVPDDATGLLDLLAPGEAVTFQTFGEGNAKGARGLNRVLHGTLAEHRPTFADLNARGAGIFWMVSAGDCKGRKAANVRRIRALFVDLDGAPLEPVQASPLAPHAIVKSSPGRWHAYWRIADCPLDQFTPLQKALAERFAADPSVHDLPRVMRLPGFQHRKGEPFASHNVTLRNAPPYTLAEFRRAFAFDEAEAPSAQRTLPRRARAAPQKQRRDLPDCIPEGERNATLFRLARGLVQRGYPAQGVNDRLQRINAERCTPPLGADEVDGIATQAAAYGSDGFTMLPDRLLDSPAWKALPPRAHDVILLAFRRYRHDTPHAGIALTWSDFQGRPGFGKKRTFYNARTAAVQSGILLPMREGRNTQKGRTPNLFGIARDVSPVPKTYPCASTQKVHPYTEKQSLRKNESDRAAAHRNHEAA